MENGNNRNCYEFIMLYVAIEHQVTLLKNSTINKFVFVESEKTH